MSCTKCNSEYHRLLKDISIIDFTLVELTLYLDIHCDDKNALEYFLHYNRIKKQLEKEFSQKFFPLSVNKIEDCNEWNWASAPLPWEGEF